MSIVFRKVDISIIKDTKFSRTWGLVESDGVTETPYPTTNDFKLIAFDRANPQVEIFNITPPSDKGAGYITFEFQSSNTAYSGLYDYVIWELLTGGAHQVVAYGTLSYIDLSKYVAFLDLVTSETPSGITIPEVFINTKSLEWRAILKAFSNEALIDAELNDDSTWPLLYNMLIAKLVVNDFLVKSLKGAMVIGNSSSSNSSNESTGNTMGIKSIETGPTKVEFQDSISSVAEFMKTSNGTNALESLQADICGLASTLKLQLEICAKRKVPVVPQYQGLPKLPTSEELLNKYY